MNFLSNLFNKKNGPVEVRKAKISTEVPTIIFNDLKLQVMVGQWEKLIEASVPIKFNIFGPPVYMHTILDAEYLIKKKLITKQLLDDISKEFGSILARVGISKDEVCIIDSYNEFNFSFNCHLKKSNKDLKIELNWKGSDWDSDIFPEIIIHDEGNMEKYEYHPSYKDNESSLKLCKYTLDCGNKTLRRSVHGYDTTFELSSGNNFLQLDVGVPDYITESANAGYRFKLKNEKELQDYLLSLSFPVDISEVYSRITEIAFGKVNNYRTFNLVVKEKVGENTSRITDNINLKNGNLLEFTITRGGRTVTIDNDGNWTFETPKESIKNHSEGNIDYRVNADSYENLLEEIGNIQDIPAIEEAERVKELSKTLFKK